MHLSTPDLGTPGKPAPDNGFRFASALGLREGDHVVHVQHGIGVYRGLVKLTTPTAEQGPLVEKEYLLIEYEAGDKLYVPADQVDRVQKYIGSEGAAPTLSKLKGAAWARAVARAKDQVQSIARELIELYAAREAATGHAYGADTPRQKEMEAAFPHTETPDQQAAIRDVKCDLEAPRPMDRLVVGDVGYGKTEVAVRAAFKVAAEGRQVAVLCPTSVLAAQHHATFSERLAGFGVTVEMLSRFRSSQEQQRVLEDLREGRVDVVIGTHRLLSEDVAFKNLGLVIVDEEQRFGVTHKEKLKQVRKTVDVLTMTATPIPRTLHAAVSGIRDLSLIDDPPEGRTPVETLVKAYDDAIVKEAIERELEREGQAYFLHNRVESIGEVAERLGKLVPGARFRVAHGQMGEDELEETMQEFYERRFDVLVCTTIIESGIDIPNANTILIDEADKLGLAQLYQLRGRVGRSDKQAYALLLVRRNEQLTEVAEQRLAALREFSDLGSGHKIALRDLELRGAGNLLGDEQSGTVTAAVGFELYMQLLEQAVRKARGEKPDPHSIPLPTVDLPVASNIPPEYIPSEAQRLLTYNQIAAVRDGAGRARLREAIESRWGKLPPSLENAFALLRLRLRCRQIGVKSISTEGKNVSITCRKGVRLPLSRLRPAIERYEAQGHSFTGEKVVLSIGSTDDVLALVEEVVGTLARALKEKQPRRRTAATTRP
uniref:Transcription-repair-coupling factor n=1 Tax=uncultured Armatimonadetes bacterium TaxID=157466 RepID=A0A6J4IFH6_9BACT|nr:Transcription-repair coupling factor [uncultured Armatimonadetes bacterium]